jgi:hypothetical protein
MSAKLNAEIGKFPKHTATFKFERIPDQDVDLVVLQRAAQVDLGVLLLKQWPIGRN